MIRRITLSVLLIAAFGFTGCSKKQEQMSTVRPYLILEIFELNQQNKHREALMKIRKLRELDQTNVLLPVLEANTLSNAELREVNQLMYHNKRKEAELLLKNIIRQHNFSGGSFTTAEKISDTLRMEQLAQHILAPRATFAQPQGYHPASEILNDSINEFLQLAQKWGVSPSLKNKVIRQIPRVSQLRHQEKLRSSLSLELFAPGLQEQSYQTMMALKFYSDGTN